MQALEAVRVQPVTGPWVVVCAVDDIIDGVGVCALIGGRQVAVFRLLDGGLYYAIDNHDPFSAANVLSRGVVGDLKGQPVVASPIYKQHFNLQTGQCLEDESVSLDIFEVRVVDGMLQILVPHQL